MNDTIDEMEALLQFTGKDANQKISCSVFTNVLYRDFWLTKNRIKIQKAIAKDGAYVRPLFNLKFI